MKLISITHVRRVTAALCFAFALLVTQNAMAACMSFVEARQAGLFSRYNLKPAAGVKTAVEARTGGKVVSLEICEPGPTYKVTVVRPGGVVSQVSVPAR